MTLEPFIKEVCREFNMKPIPSTQEWEAASKLCKLSKPLREMSVFFEGEKYPTLCSISRLITIYVKFSICQRWSSIFLEP